MRLRVCSLVFQPMEGSDMSGQAPIKYPDCFFVDGKWAKPSSSAKIDVLNSNEVPE